MDSTVGNEMETGVQGLGLEFRGVCDEFMYAASCRTAAGTFQEFDDTKYSAKLRGFEPAG